MSTFQVTVHLPLTAAPIAYAERHLTERDLAGPSGQHHERESDHGEDHDRGGLDDLVGPQQDGDEHETEQDQRGRTPTHEADQREAGDGGPERSDLVGETPSGRLVAVRPAELPALQQQRDQHRRAHDRSDEQRAARVPGHSVLQDAEGHGGRGDRRLIAKSADDGRGKGLYRAAGSAAPSGTPSTPARRNRARNDNPAAIAHTSVDSHATGIRACRARSLRSADPRIAVPIRVEPRKSATPIMARGATIERDEVIGRQDEGPDGDLPVEGWGNAL